VHPLLSLSGNLPGCGVVALIINGNTEPTGIDMDQGYLELSLCIRQGAGAQQETAMGLLDVLNGMQNSPRSPSNPNRQSSDSGMSPMIMAVLGLLAGQAIKHFSGQSDAAPKPTRTPSPGNVAATFPDGAVGGNLGDLLKGGLGGLLAGGAGGSVISGGLGELLKQLQQSGQGDTANSWVGKGENKPIAPTDLANALGADQIDTLASHSGLSREDLLGGLSQYLPNVIDHLTPDGRLPTEKELAGRL
jgi:uncharacterized protein YidB (DUF937 family)